jgi:hydroxymethylcytosylglucuronate/cytosylglucuronate synthase
MKTVVIYSEFGLGPYGKARSIIESRSKVGLPSIVSASDFLQTPARYFSKLGDQIFIIVGDPECCDVTKDLGGAVVYVDSLPFLWNQNDHVATSADVYCAQMTDALPNNCWSVLSILLPKLVWVDPIIPYYKIPKSSFAGMNYWVVHLGGVESPVAGWENYLNVIVPSLIHAAKEEGIEKMRIFCGVKAAKFMKNLIHTPLGDVDVTSETVSGSTLLEAALGARRVFSSPGLTFMHECSAIGVALTLLPPQNISQKFNREFYVRNSHGHPFVDWPFDVEEFLMGLDLNDEMDEIQKVNILYVLIGNLIGDVKAGSFISKQIRESIAEVLTFKLTDGDGASQIWDEVRKLESLVRGADSSLI